MNIDALYYYGDDSFKEYVERVNGEMNLYRIAYVQSTYFHNYDIAYTLTDFT